MPWETGCCLSKPRGKKTPLNPLSMEKSKQAAHFNSNFLLIQIIEQEAQKMISESKSTSGDDSSQENEEDDKDVPMAEMEDDIPLTKSGYPVPPAYPPIQASLMESVPEVLVQCYAYFWLCQ